MLNIKSEREKKLESNFQKVKPLYFLFKIVQHRCVDMLPKNFKLT